MAYRPALSEPQRALLNRIVQSKPNGLKRSEVNSRTAACLKHKGLIAWNGRAWFALPRGCEVNLWEQANPLTWS